MFKLNNSRYLVSGTLHETYPILLGKCSCLTLVIGKSPKGRLLLQYRRSDYEGPDSLFAGSVLKKLSQVDQLDLG